VKKTSIYLEPELDRALARRAAANGVSKAELIRETLRRSVSGDRPRIEAIGIIEGPGDVADNVDRYLAEGFGRD
jgi:plasmid stability protein